jgi:signal peptidase I
MKLDTAFSPGDKVFVTRFNNGNPQVQKVTVGKVQVEVTDSPGRPGEDLFDNYKPQKGYKESYMMVECGIGSGSIFTLNENVFHTEPECEAAISTWRKENPS